MEDKSKREIWMIIRKLPKFTLDDLEIILDIPKINIREYLNTLIEMKVVRKIGEKKTGVSRPLFVYKVIRNDGPQLPEKKEEEKKYDKFQDSPLFQIYKKEYEVKGATTVGKELEISRTSAYCLYHGTYPAGTKRMEQRIRLIYGNKGKVDCPVFGELSPGLCAETYQNALNIGFKVSNPEKLRLYSTCKKCKNRGGR